MSSGTPEPEAAASTESQANASAEPAANPAAADPAAALPAAQPITAEPTQAPPRPQPRYGEYAPEGAEPAVAQDPAQTALPGSAPVMNPTPNTSGGGAYVGPTVPGVPHNLGVDRTAGDPAPQPYRAAPTAAGPASPADTSGGSYRATAPAGAAMPATHGRRGDRVVTIVLLVIGALGALLSAGVFQQLRDTLVIYTSAFDIDASQIPGWVGLAGTIGALAVLALYAVTLIASIGRMRAGKLSFYIPLIAGVIAAIATTVVLNVAVLAVPGLFDAFTAPGALDQLMNYLTEMTAP